VDKEKIPIADLGLSGLVAIAADVSQAATVVALLSLAAVFRHVAYYVNDEEG
jgi:hypothetical protein